MTVYNGMRDKLLEILGEDGFPKSHEDLPPPTIRRWVIRRKAQVVAGIEINIMSEEEAISFYNLSAEELASWRRLLLAHGLKGLRATRIQDYR